MKKEAGAFQRRRQRGAIAQIALAQSVGRVEICARARWTREHTDVVAADPERGGDRRTEKAACARDKNGRPRRKALALGLDGNLARAARRSKARMSHGWSDFTIHVIWTLPDRGAIPKPSHRRLKIRENS